MGLSAAEGDRAAAPSSDVRLGGATDVAAMGGDCMAAPTSGTRIGGATDLVVASDDHAAAPSPRTMMDGGVGLGHGGQLPRRLPLVGAECDLMGLAAAEGGNAAAPWSGMSAGERRSQGPRGLGMARHSQ